MYRTTKEEILELIDTEDRYYNLLFTNVPDDTMTAVINRLSKQEVREKGYLLIDFNQAEVKHIEDMINYTDRAFYLIEQKEIKEEMDDIQKNLKKLESVMKSCQSFSNILKEKKENLIIKMHELEKFLIKDEESEKLRRFLVVSSIAEEYVLGKIISELVKVPELADKYRINNIDDKIQYFEDFLKKDGIIPEEYEDFNDKRFALIVESLPLLQWSESDITCCFTNFQNVSNELINRVINNFTAFNTIRFRTMIFTTADRMLTIKCRDNGQVKEPYEYLAYTLNKAKK